MSRTAMAARSSASCCSTMMIVVVVVLLCFCSSPSVYGRSLGQKAPMSVAMPRATGEDFDLNATLGANYSILYNAAYALDLISTLMEISTRSGATVLAPTNEAFNALGSGLACISQNSTVLENIIAYHTIPASYPASTASNVTTPYVELPTTSPNNTITIFFDVPNAVIINKFARFAHVVQPDLVARTNLTFHGIDTVLIPPMYISDPSVFYCATAAASTSAPTPPTTETAPGSEE